MRRIKTLAIVAGLAILVAACSNPAASTAPSSAAPPPASVAAVSEAPSSVAPTAMKVGYISLGESIPFVSLVTNSIKDEAAKVPGLEIVVCDSEIDAAKALACAQNLKVQEVQAVLNFQLFEDSSPEVCTAYGGLPTIAIDIHQAPCEVAFMGADNTLAGTLAGKTVGDALKAENDCTYQAVVTHDTKGCR
jgi:ribose transport system substrate-binding protein